MSSGQTDITEALNNAIHEPGANPGDGTPGTNFIFDYQNPKVGGGVLFRDRDDGLTWNWLEVAPATFIHNALFTPNIAYMARQGGYIDGTVPALGMISWDKDWGWSKLWDEGGGQGKPDLRNPSWNHGVFYPHDSNAADKRGFWDEVNHYYSMPYSKEIGGQPYRDKTQYGAGARPAGNPLWDSSKGGGTGLHCGSTYDQVRDAGPTATNTQFNIDGKWAKSAHPIAFYNSPHCDINVNHFSPSSLGNRPSYDGIDQWSENGFLKLTMQTFLDLYPEKQGENWEHYLFDLIGWTPYIHAMLTLQNALWKHRGDYNSTCKAIDYRGWNEIPMSTETMNDTSTWGSACIVLPLNLNSIRELDLPTQEILASKIETYVNNGWIKPGVDHITERSGSYIVVLGQYSKSDSDPNNYRRWFFGESIELPATKNGNKYRLVFVDESKDGGVGKCYLDWY